MKGLKHLPIGELWISNQLLLGEEKVSLESGLNKMLSSYLESSCGAYREFVKVDFVHSHYPLIAFFWFGVQVISLQFYDLTPEFSALLEANKLLRRIDTPTSIFSVPPFRRRCLLNNTNWNSQWLLATLKSSSSNWSNPINKRTRQFRTGLSSGSVWLTNQLAHFHRFCSSTFSLNFQTNIQVIWSPQPRPPMKSESVWAI